jgi:DNA repair protein RadC
METLQLQYTTKDDVIDAAICFLEERAKTYDGQPTFTDPRGARVDARLRIADRDREVFLVYFLNTQHALITAEEMFWGTIDGAAVYPREVAKTALQHNAAAVIFAHNHPSGIVEPSSADRHITTRLVESLRLLDIRVLDHIIVSHKDTMSFAERGLL